MNMIDDLTCLMRKRLIDKMNQEVDSRDRVVHNNMSNQCYNVFLFYF